MYWSRERPCLLSVSFFIVCSRAAAFKAIVTGTALLRGSFSAGVRARLLPCLFLPSRRYARCVLSRITIYSARFRGIIKVCIIYKNREHRRAYIHTGVAYAGFMISRATPDDGDHLGERESTGELSRLSWFSFLMKRAWNITQYKSVLNLTHFTCHERLAQSFCVNLTRSKIMLKSYANVTLISNKKSNTL